MINFILVWFSHLVFSHYLIKLEHICHLSKGALRWEQFVGKSWKITKKCNFWERRGIIREKKPNSSSFKYYSPSHPSTSLGIASYWCYIGFFFVLHKLYLIIHWKIIIIIIIIVIIITIIIIIMMIIIIIIIIINLLP